MTQYFTDFSDSPAWTERWDVDVGDFAITDTGIPTGSGSHALWLEITPDGFNRYMVSWDEVGTPTGDVQILVRWQQDTSFGDENGWAGRCFICGAGAANSDNEDGYYAGHTTDGGASTQTLQKYDGGASSDLGTYSDTLSANTWYWTRIEKSGTTIRKRTWADGSSEPGTWDVSVTDSALSGGWVGVGLFEDTVNDPGRMWVSQIGAGTAGDEAPSSGAETLNAAFVSSGSQLFTASLSETVAAPTNLVATQASSSQIDLTWTDNATTETEYQVERSLDGSTNWTVVASGLAANSTSHSDTGLDPDTEYFYRVRAVRVIS